MKTKKLLKRIRNTQLAILVIMFVIVVIILLASPVRAETLTGTLGSTTANYTGYNIPSTGAGATAFTRLNAKNIENTVGLNTIILTSTAQGGIFTFSNATATGNTTSVQLKVGAQIVGNGTMGIVRSFSGSPPVENIGNYVFIVFTDYDPGALTGNQIIVLDYDAAALYNPSASRYTVAGYLDGVNFGDASTFPLPGDVIQVYDYATLADYTTTKPGGLGINGTITKNVGGTVYNSQAFVVNGSNPSQIYASNYAVNAADLNFNVPLESIIIAIKNPYGSWFNSSVLFAPVMPTVTPTPTTTIPPGYIVSYVRTFDTLANTEIHGADISIYDVEAATWTNCTADADGRCDIYTLPYHTLNCYGHYPTAGIYNDGETLGVEVGYSGGNLFYVDMYPYTIAPATGNTYLYTTVRDSLDKSPVRQASIVITAVSTGATYGTNSGSTGVSVDLFPNNTALRIDVRKDGYNPASIATNTGTGTTKYVYVDMVRSVVTPTVTVTPLPGEVTVRPTYSAGCDPSSYDAALCSSGKDSAMMEQIRDAGPGLIALAILATIFGLIKLMIRK